jgi:hypothetical protein
MSDPRGFEPTERRDDPDEISPDAEGRDPVDDQADSSDYADPRADEGAEGRPTV